MHALLLPQNACSAIATEGEGGHTRFKHQLSEQPVGFSQPSLPCHHSPHLINLCPDVPLGTRSDSLLGVLVQAVVPYNCTLVVIVVKVNTLITGMKATTHSVRDAVGTVHSALTN